jgi:hypothetical protein
MVGEHMVERIVRRQVWRRASIAVVALWGVGCGSLLDVDDPTVVTPEQLQGPTGVSTISAGIIGDFQDAYDDAVFVMGILTDEYVLSGSGSQALDHRFPEVGDFRSPRAFERIQVTRQSAEDATTAFEDALGDPDFADVRDDVLEALVLAKFYGGYTLVLQASGWCQSILESKGVPLLSDAAHERAIGLFQEAQQRASDAGRQDIITASQVGMARSRLWQKDYSGAASLAQSVPSDFVYVAEYSENDPAQYNLIYGETHGVGFFRRFTVGDGTAHKHAFEKYPFFDEWLRQGLIRRGDAGAGEVAMDPEVPLVLQLLYDNQGGTMVLASGWEARMIEAEALLRAGSLAAAEDMINTLLTADQSINPMKLVNPKLPLVPFEPVDFTGDLMQDLPELGRARASGLWMTGSRMTTLRRFLDDGLDLYPVKPLGGTATCFPMPLDEQLNNPNVDGPYPS